MVAWFLKRKMAIYGDAFGCLWRWRLLEVVAAARFVAPERACVKKVR